MVLGYSKLVQITECRVR